MPGYRLSAAARDDIVRLLAHTLDQFGEVGLRRYEALLIVGLRDIAAPPERPGTIARPELGAAVRSYHLRHSRDRARTEEGAVRRPRHIVLYRTLTPALIGVGRILHDSADLERHRPTRYGDP